MTWKVLAPAAALAVFGALVVYGPVESGPEKPLEAATTLEPGPPASPPPPIGPGPYSAVQTAARTRPDPLAGFEGRYACRFATAGRITPCCPDTTETLSMFWAGADLAVADYIIGRESGCNPRIVNSSGCVGWFQLCGWTCSGSCRDGYANAEKAHELWERYGWCSTASWYLRGDPVTGGSC